ncbi:MAG: hypothetical protein K5648_06100 [Erysipelotrichaceae bacterium]|nr:hypothetical protein [Erysipelotrichaceae bacterium]
MNKRSYKKLTLLLAALFLVSCAAKDVPVIPEEEVPADIVSDDFIAPVNDVFLFSKLDEDLQKRIKTANCDADYENYQFKMLGKDVCEEKFTDINGNQVDFKHLGTFYLEVVSVECSHCKKQLAVIEDLVSGQDRPFLQYFNVGEKDEILSFYEEQDVSMSSEITVLSHDDVLEEYLRHKVGIKKYPTLLCFAEGKLCFSSVGEVDEEAFEMIESLCFEEPVDIASLKDEGGELLIDASRSSEDVWNDLSKENQEKIESLDNDDYTKDLTLKLMGKRVDFSRVVPGQGDMYYSQVDDFKHYEKEDLILLYTYLRDNSETDKVAFINELIDLNDGNRYIVVLVEGLESSSVALRNMDAVFHCPVVSVLGRMPEQFFDFGLVGYPTAVFIDHGVFTGAYSNIEDKEKFALSKLMFLSGDSIARRSNN